LLIKVLQGALLLCEDRFTFLGVLETPAECLHLLLKVRGQLIPEQFGRSVAVHAFLG
jgi:hypothetical protein